MLACGDAKCKIESTIFSSITISNSLDKVLEQLPRDRPGIAFIKMPPKWLKEVGFERITTEVANDFLRQTRRIVSVKYYVSTVTYTDGMVKV
jgi:hypothetical protein